MTVLIFCCRFDDFHDLYLERELRRSRRISQQRLQQPLDRPKGANFIRRSELLSETHPCMMCPDCRISKLSLSPKLSDWSASHGGYIQ